MNKTKKIEKNNKTFRKIKKGGMENDDNYHYYPSYIEEKKKFLKEKIQNLKVKEDEKVKVTKKS